jgi:hypothetical protein
MLEVNPPWMGPNWVRFDPELVLVSNGTNGPREWQAATIHSSECLETTAANSKTASSIETGGVSSSFSTNFPATTAIPGQS